MMDSGTCRIYTVTDAAENGEMPAPTLHEYGDYEWAFEDRMISYSRQYAAMGADQQIDRIIRIWRTPQGRNIESITYSRPLMTMGLRSQT